MPHELLISNRTRTTPFTSRVEACGVKAYTVYNHMLLPAVFRGLEEDYWHLCEAVQLWDVSCQRQVEIIGPDTQKLVQLMTPRDISRAQIGQCLYAPLCDENGYMINDPILIKHSQDHWWLSIADTDVVLWAKGLATGYGFDVQVHEPDIWPLAVQGPKAEELVSRVFGEGISSIGFFRGEWKKYDDTSFYIARSGWSKQGGFEIYVNDFNLGEKLWDDFFEKGRDLNVGAGCPNLIERIESGLLSFGADATYETTPFECGLDQYVSLDADIESLSINALRKKQKPKTRLVGLVINEKINLADRLVLYKKEVIGEITANTWSPKYSVYLAYARCDFNRIEALKELNVKSTTGLVKAKLTDLPFNFEALGLGSQSLT